MTISMTPLSAQNALRLRLIAGALIGFIIALLIKTAPVGGDTGAHMTRQASAATLVLIAFVIWAGAGTMRFLTHIVWTGIATCIVGYLVWYAMSSQDGRDFPFGGQAILIFPFLFIAHELVSSGDQAGKVIAPYEIYFDEAWKRGVQLALAILFTLLFWGILLLGSILLGLIGFKWLGNLLSEKFFAWPLTGLAFGAAVHLGDVQTKLLSNVRGLILGVLSWLLPVITVIGGIFAISLAFSGLAPLWATKAATASLLTGCVGFTLLTNAAYQQGDEERHIPIVLKWCVRISAVLLLIFASLAGWSLWLRIAQYGLSADRIFAGLGVVIALAYGASYTASVFVKGRWMRAVESCNVYLAAFMCALFLAILTPIATPDRLSVNSQVDRLISGKVSVANFDWWLLKDDTGEYGQSALRKLSGSANQDIAAKAKLALENKIGERPSAYRDEKTEAPERPIDLSKLEVVFPRGAKLPTSFIQTDFQSGIYDYSLPGCLRIGPEVGQAPSCKAALLDLNGDGQNEVVLREGPSLTILTQIKGVWVGNLDYIDAGSLEADFDAGRIKASTSLWNDLVIGETRKKIPSFRDPPADAANTPVPVPAPPSK